MARATTKKKPAPYEGTPEFFAALPAHTAKWIANAMSTAPMTDEDRAACVEAVRGVYAAAGLAAPRVVFVPSPFVLRFAGGFAAAIWHQRKGGKNAAATLDATYAATDDATLDATYAATDATLVATRAATDDATIVATYDATRVATRDATDDATRDATRVATRDATDDATDDATYDTTDAATYAATDATLVATDDATRVATTSSDSLARWYVCPVGALARLGRTLTGSDFGVQCAQRAWRMWQGGNQWSAWAAYLTAFRDLAKLPLDYTAYNHWVTLAERSGPRIVHPEFCMIADRPAVLTVDEANRPHNATGPFCQWRDGTALYSWHGIRVPGWVIEQPDRITAATINAEPNQEVRRAMIERIGWERYLSMADATVLQADDYGTLLDLPPMPDDTERVRLVRVTNSTPEPDGSFKDYVLRVPPACESARAAVAWTFGVEQPEAYAPLMES